MFYIFLFVSFFLYALWWIIESPWLEIDRVGT